tara:strand:- start:7839 stop:7979 length:141 start_codon:yes stop_codon:yes gene_type:complete
MINNSQDKDLIGLIDLLAIEINKLNTLYKKENLVEELKLLLIQKED